MQGVYLKQSSPFSKIFLTQLVLVLFSLASYSQNQTYTMWKNNGYGLINESGKEIFPAIAVSADETRQEHIIIYDRASGKYGLNSKNNTVILPVIYERLNRFRSGYYLFQDNKFGYADNSGKVIIPVKYSRIEATSRNTLLISPDSLYGISDTMGKEIIAPEYESISTYCNPYIAKKSGKFGLLDPSGKVIVPFEYDDISLASYSDHFIITLNEKRAVIDPKGKIIIPMEYDNIESEENPFTSQARFITIKKGRKGAYRIDGSKYVDAIYNEIRFIQYNYAIGISDGQMCLLDSNGKTLIPFCNEIKASGDDDLLITKKNGLCGVRDIQGKPVIPEAYKGMSELDEDELFNTTLNNKLICFDKKGKRTVSPHIDTDSLFKKYKDYEYLGSKTVALRNTDKWRVFNTYRKKYFPGVYDKAYYSGYALYVLPGQKEAVYGDYDFMERQLITITEPNSIGKAIYVLNDKKTGVLDENGKVLIPAEYEDIGVFFRGRALCKKNGRYGYINGNNTVIIPFEFDSLETPAEFSGDKLVTSNFLKASKNRKFGMIDSTGKTIIGFNFDELSNFKDGYAIVRSGSQTGVIDSLGNFLVALQALPLDAYVKGMGVVFLGQDPIIYLNAAGKEIWHNDAKKHSISVDFYQQSIPANVGLLKDLEHFSLTFRDPDILGMSGAIPLPASVYRMEKLKTLDLNFKTACLSPYIRNLKNLRTLNISFLTGCNKIPKEICELPLLDSLKINTYYTGYEYGEVIGQPVLPEEIGNVKSLHFLDCYVPFKTLPSQLKYLSLHVDTIKKEMTASLSRCTDLEKLEIHHYHPEDSLLREFLKSAAALKKLKHFTLVMDYSAPSIYMIANPASIDTLKITDTYFLDYNVYHLFSERQITYLSTEADTFYFPKLEHLHCRGQDQYRLPRGLDSCKSLKKLDLSLSSDASWEEIEQKLLKLPLLASLQLTMEPYGRESIFLNDGFYRCLKTLAAAGKLKNLLMVSSLLDEKQQEELKSTLPELNISIIKPDPYN